MYNNIMSDLLDRITIDPEVCHGVPCIRGMRHPVETVLEYLAGGDTAEDILAEFSELEKEDILACIAFAARSVSLRNPELQPA